MVPLDTGSHLLDRFFIGGPLSVRGFALRGIGPHDQSDALGGDVYLEGNLALSFPILPRWSSFMRGQVFANGGNLSSYQAFSRLDPFLRSSDVAIGYGVIFKILNMARLEINATYPIVCQTSHRPHAGLQFGLGLDFL